jgi:hypothetical protein
MKLVSYFSEVRIIYYEFSKEKPISEINKRVSEKKNTKQRHVAALGRATWHADVSMTSSGGSGMMTSAVGPVDVSVDRSTVNGQGGGCGQRAPPVSLTPRLTDGPHGSGRKRKRKDGLAFHWAEKGVGPAWLAQEGSARLVTQLGLRLSRPARAGGLAGHEAGSARILCGPASSPPWAGLVASPSSPRGPATPDLLLR